MNKITVSAPGKLMLLGDHAVVHSRPCLVTAVGQRMKATVTLLDVEEFQLEAPDVKVEGYKKPMSELGNGEIPKGAKFVEVAVKNFVEKYGSSTKSPIKGVRVETKSEFSSQFGFGSSSASTVCTLKALFESVDINAINKDIFELAYKTVIDIQGVGSGFDTAAAIYGGVLFFIGGGKAIEPVPVKSLPLIVGYSGIKADTPTLVKALKAKMEAEPTIYLPLFDVSTEVVLEGKKALLTNNLEKFGDMMNVNEGLLSSYGVEIGKLAAMIHGARDAGAYGAKLSGAGGGDCMIAVAPEDKAAAVKQAITAAGGQVIELQTNVEGAKVES